MDNRIKQIVDFYGKDSQVDITIEECSELIKALLKERRYPGSDRLAIIDEIADVEIMLNQLKIIFDCEIAVDCRIGYKLKRQLERMKKS